MHFSLKVHQMRTWRIFTIPPGHIHGNYFCWGFMASFIRTQNSSSALTVTARSRVVSTSAAIFSSLIDGCLKYNNKEEPKTGQRFGPCLDYDVNTGPKPSPRDVKKSESDFKLNIKKNYILAWKGGVTQELLNMYQVKYYWKFISIALHYCVTAKGNQLL